MEREFPDIHPPQCQFLEMYNSQRADMEQEKLDRIKIDGKKSFKKLMKRKKFKKVPTTDAHDNEVTKTSAKDNWIKYKTKIISRIRMKRLLHSAELLRRGKDEHEIDLEEETFRFQWLLLSPESSRRLFWEYVVMILGVLDIFINIYCLYTEEVFITFNLGVIPIYLIEMYIN